jgi:hypothetical protein
MGKPGESAAAESWRNVRRPLSGINVRKAEIQARCVRGSFWADSTHSDRSDPYRPESTLGRHTVRSEAAIQSGRSGHSRQRARTYD